MIPKTPAFKQYDSAHKRSLEAAIIQFFATEFPKLFGPRNRQMLAEMLLELVEQQFPAYTHLKPGQCLWNAVDIETRADHPKLRLVPVILTLVEDSDITRLAAGERQRGILSDATARLLDEAYQQGGLLSMRDIALLTWHRETAITGYRQDWEQTHHRILPHPGTLQDMGSCITHKIAIVTKAFYERKDTRQVARETHHSQQAVDRYLKDFHRVRTCYLSHPDLAFICQVTGMHKFVVKQYLDIIHKYEGRDGQRPVECATLDSA
jgi:hypothetical protein